MCGGGEGAWECVITYLQQVAIYFIKEQASVWYGKGIHIIDTIHNLVLRLSIRNIGSFPAFQSET